MPSILNTKSFYEPGGGSESGARVGSPTPLENFRLYNFVLHINALYTGCVNETNKKMPLKIK